MPYVLPMPILVIRLPIPPAIALPTAPPRARLLWPAWPWPPTVAAGPPLYPAPVHWYIMQIDQVWPPEREWNTLTEPVSSYWSVQIAYLLIAQSSCNIKIHCPKCQRLILPCICRLLFCIHQSSYYSSRYIIHLYWYLTVKWKLVPDGSSSFKRIRIAGKLKFYRQGKVVFAQVSIWCLCRRKNNRAREILSTFPLHIYTWSRSVTMGEVPCHFLVWDLYQ